MKYHGTIKFAAMTIAAVVFSAGSAYASVHIGGGNGTTGPNSENNNIVEYSSESRVEISNRADADNDFELSIETGDNSWHENTEVGDISTGEVEGDIVINNDLNSGDIDLGGAWDDWGLAMIDFANSLTGPESVNNNSVTIENERKLEIENHADINNDMEIRANSGDNHISHNTVVGDFDGGKVDIGGTITNKANAGMGNIDLGSAGMGSISADFTNHITGPNSENTNTLAIENESKVEVENHADIDNDLELRANTGDNTIGHNTVVGDVSTGKVRIDFSITNVAN